jgi:hypothetical protein
LAQRLVAVLVGASDQPLEAFTSLGGRFIGRDFAVGIFIEMLENLLRIRSTSGPVCASTWSTGTAAGSAACKFGEARSQLVFGQRAVAVFIGLFDQSFESGPTLFGQFAELNLAVAVGIESLEHRFGIRATSFGAACFWTASSDTASLRPASFRPASFTSRAIGPAAFASLVTFCASAGRGIFLQSGGEFLETQRGVTLFAGHTQQAPDETTFALGHFIATQLAVVVGVELFKEGRWVWAFGGRLVVGQQSAGHEHQACRGRKATKHRAHENPPWNVHQQKWR